jgi:hypothetical protein
VSRKPRCVRRQWHVKREFVRCMNDADWEYIGPPDFPLEYLCNALAVSTPAGWRRRRLSAVAFWVSA